MKIVISEKSGKSYQAELAKDKEPQLYGKKIGDEIEGGIIGAAGYTLEITGGSDISGFPMRNDVSGGRRARIVLTQGPGFRPSHKGQRSRKTVHGNTVDSQIVQINTKVKAAGATPLETTFPKAEKKEEKKEKK
ncbi:30S ribosomal protein S6e [Candidatus Parvarchaeota archaeon]|nr:30S ribosomal protein S6e [Candidatus Parvarchaeota archaeon]